MHTAIEYDDNTEMPFGKYQGVKLANVPASYLLWLYEKGPIDYRLRGYILDNMDVLKQEK